MIYLIYGTDSYLRNREIKKIASSYNKDSIQKFDLETDSLKNVIDDANTNSLFSNEKLLIVNNSYIFSAKKNSIDHDLSELEEYFKYTNPSATVIFSLDYEKIDERKKITKKIKEVGKAIDCNNVANIKEIVKEMFGDFKINSSDIDLFIERAGSNLALIEQEVLKLKSYSNEVITKDDILNVTFKTSSPDIFEFIEAIVSKNIKKAYLIYQELITINEEAIKIIVMLANQFRLIYQSKLLQERGFDINYIASSLDVHPYRVKLALMNGKQYNNSLLLSYIKQLAEIDYKIKSGEIDKNLALEMFILQIKSNI